MSEKSSASQREKHEKELFIFARFHAREHEEGNLAKAIREVGVQTRKEHGCLRYDAFVSIKDPRLYFIHSLWINEKAFNRHSELPHTIRFIEHVEGLIDHELDVNRTRLIAL